MRGATKATHTHYTHTKHNIPFTNNSRWMCVLINENRHKSSIDLHWNEWFNLIAAQNLCFSPIIYWYGCWPMLIIYILHKTHMRDTHQQQQQRTFTTEIPTWEECLLCIEYMQNDVRINSSHRLSVRRLLCYERWKQRLHWQSNITLI